MLSDYNPKDEFLKAISLQRLKPYMMQEQNNRNNGSRIAPDTLGVDYFFLIGFMTPQMEDDFPVIERDFLNNCRTKIDEFNAVGWYETADISTYNPIQSLRTNILRLIYNGAKADHQYCVDLIIYLYKTYHKSEYNQLKRFKKLSGEDILNLSEDPESIINEKLTMARILAMGSFMRIEIDEKCALFYHSLIEDRKIYLSALDGYKDTTSFSKEKLKEYGDLLDTWMKEAKEKNNDEEDPYYPYVEAVKFIEERFRQHGFSYDYMQLCTNDEGSRAINLIYSLATLKRNNPKKEYALRDIYIYSVIEQLITALTDTVSNYDYEVGYLLGDQLDEDELEGVLYKPGSVVDKESSKDRELTKQVNTAPIDDSTATKEDYRAEVDTLRGNIKSKEQEIKYLRDNCRVLKQTAEEANNRINILEADREELIALRNFVYNLKDEEVPDENKLSKMRETIAAKRILVIGGHPNWHNKLRKQFPDWSFLYMDEYKTITPSMLENYDYVFFYTDYLSHKSYNKCVAMLRENSIPFGYLRGINPDITVKQVYERIQ